MAQRGTNMRLFVVAAFVAAIMALGASAAFAGEITGNGTYKGTNPNASACAYSGQEDLQWYYDNGEGQRIPADQVVKGSPAHSQNWGHTDGHVGGGGAGPAGCNKHVGEG